MDEDKVGKWVELFSPDLVRSKLVTASLFLAAFELLRESIVGRIQTFFSKEYVNGKFVVGEEYTEQVLTLHKRVLFASAEWLKNNNVINNTDISNLHIINDCRNKIAHELPLFLFGAADPGHIDLFPELFILLKKIEIWWIVNFEIPINPDFDGADINEEEISTGPLITLKMLCDMALGNEEVANSYLAEFHKYMAKK